jgi:hypothetical protein
MPDVTENNCTHENFTTIKNVGYDADPTGEENQHIDNCLDCGCCRWRIERLQNFTDYHLILGEWGSNWYWV